MAHFEKIKEMMKKNSVSDLFSPLSYNEENNLYFLEDGSLGYAIEIDPQFGGTTASSDNIKTLLNKKYPENTLLQFVLWKSPDISRQIGDIRRIKSSHRSDLKASTEARIKFLQDGVNNPVENIQKTKISDVRGFVFVIFSNKSKQSNSGKSIPFTVEDFVEMESVYENLLNGFKSLNFNPRKITSNRLINICNSMLDWDNPDYDNVSIEKRNGFIKDYFVPNNYKLEVEDSFINIQNGKKFIKTYSIDKYPSMAYASLATYYLGDVLSGHATISDNTLFSCTLLFSDQQTKSDKILASKAWVTNQLQHKLTFDKEYYQNRLEDFKSMNASITNGESVVDVMFTITLFGDSEKSIKENGDNLMQYFMTSNLGFKLTEETDYVLPIFVSSLPFGPEIDSLKYMNRLKMLSSEHVSMILPVQSDWKGSETPALNMVSRNGQLVNLDFRDTDLASNGIIIGSSGAGKSFFTNEIVNSYLQMDCQVWILDAGRSYKKLCDVYDGDFIEFEKNDSNDMSLNPFSTVNDINEDMNRLMTVLTSMASINNELSDTQVATLKNILREEYSKYADIYDMDKLVYRLMGDEDGRVRDMGIQLKPFSTDGDYGKWFNGENTVSFNNDLTVLELDGLSSDSHLQKVVLLQLISNIEKIVYEENDKSKRKILLIDEAWQVLVNGSSIKSFIEGAFRKFRKYNGSIIVISQSLEDLYMSKSSQAIVNNAPFKFILKSEEVSIDRVHDSKKMTFKGWELDAVKSLSMHKGEYSEIFAMTPSGNGVVRFIPDDYHKILYSTDPDEVYAIDELKKTGLSTSESINKYLSDR